MEIRRGNPGVHQSKSQQNHSGESRRKDPGVSAEEQARKDYQPPKTMGDHVKGAAAGVAKGAGAVAATGALLYAGGSAALGHGTHQAMERGLDGLGDDLTHILTHAMSGSHFEEAVALRGHGRCAATQMSRPMPYMGYDYGDRGNSNDGPDY